jgi:hypothetical protein
LHAPRGVSLFSSDDKRQFQLSAPEIQLHPIERSHLVQFYGADAYLVDLVTRFLGVGLAAGEPLVAILTPEHRGAVERRLESVGFDVADATATGRLRLLDARETLDKLLLDDMPHPEHLQSVIGGLLVQAAQQAPRRRMRVFGEMVDVLWRDGKRDAAIRLEELWNELQSRHDFNLLCAYCLDDAYCETNATLVDRIRHAHTRQLPRATS